MYFEIVKKNCKKSLNLVNQNNTKMALHNFYKIYFVCK